MSFTPFDEGTEPPHTLLLAAKEQRYGVLYALLKQQKEPLPLQLALEVASAGLGCSLRAFRAILDRCPPPEVMDAGLLPCWHNLDEFFSDPLCPLVEKAAYEGRPEHLDELLRRGFDPNDSRDGYEGSLPLLAAFYGRSVSCVERLLREPGLNCTLTPYLVSLWSSLGGKESGALARCCIAAAPRLFENAERPTLSFRGVPLPPQLTLGDVLLSRNWVLAEYLCRHTELTVEDGDNACRMLDLLILGIHLTPGPHGLDWVPSHGCPSRKELTAFLGTLFTVCPQLLRRRLPKTLLIFAALTGPSVAPVLRPLLDRISTKNIPLDPAPGLQNLSLILPLWKERLGQRCIPVLDPKAMSELCSFCDIFPSLSKTLDVLFSHCTLRRIRPGKELSALSLVLLHGASMSLLLRQLQEGGLLRMENPELLLNYCLSPEGIPPSRRVDRFSFYDRLATGYPLTFQRRQAVLVHIKREVDYAL